MGCENTKICSQSVRSVGLCKPPELVASVLSEDSLVGDSALNLWKLLTPSSWVRIALQALRAQGGKKTVRDVMSDLDINFDQKTWG